MNSYTEPDYSKAALLTIDMQEDFWRPGEEDYYDRKRAVEAAVRLARVFRQTGKPIIHIVRLYLDDGSNVDLCRRKTIEEGKRTVSPGSRGARIISDIIEGKENEPNPELLLEGGVQQVGNREYMIYKPRFGSFYRTPLEDLLRKKGINTLVFTGFNFPNCPRSSIYEASERDFRIVFVENGISNMYERGMKELEAIGAVRISCADLLEKILPGS